KGDCFTRWLGQSFSRCSERSCFRLSSRLCSRASHFVMELQSGAIQLWNGPWIAIAWACAGPFVTANSQSALAQSELQSLLFLHSVELLVRNFCLIWMKARSGSVELSLPAADQTRAFAWPTARASFFAHSRKCRSAPARPDAPTTEPTPPVS